MPLETLEFARSHRQEHLEDLRMLCRQPSIASQNVGVKESAGMVKAMMEKAGLHAEIIPIPGGQPVVFGELNLGRKHTLLFYNHYDVQPPEPFDQWVSPPFAAEVRDGKLFARGVADNKGNLVSRLAAVSSFMQTKGTLPVNVKFVVEGEEEIGSVNFHTFVETWKERLFADAVIWEAGYTDVNDKPVISFGNKGICYVELRATGANSDLHSSLAAIVPNPAWRLVEALSTIKDVKSDRCLVDGFYDDVLAASPREIELLKQNPLDEPALLKSFGLDSFILGLTGLDLSLKYLYQPTCTICGLTSGYSGHGTKTVLPNEARVKIDFRLVPNQSAEEVFRKLRSHLDRRGFTDIEATFFSHEDPGQSALDSAIVPVVIETARETYGVEPVVHPRSAGSGPMYLFNRFLGIPTVGGVGVGWHGSRQHAPNESIRLSEYYLGIEHIIRIMDAFGK
jgi:acetylornithine deacetylase/succinyl-diaminopimelate desuccinylase-like protein